MAAIYGTSSSETLDAFDGVTKYSDTILGFEGQDTIYGLGGNDHLKGGGGADALKGGADIDTAYYDDSTSGIAVSLASGTGMGGSAEGDTLESVENLWGSNYGDQLTGDLNANVLTGSQGNDSLFGGTGDDMLDGGEGSDTIAYGNNIEGLTVNLLTGLATTTSHGADYDQLVGIESASGTWGKDVFTGNDADNRFVGFQGLDVFHAGGGNDFLWGGFAGDVLDGGSGTDTAYYGDSYFGVTVNLASGLGDGADAFGDTLTDIEIVIGSRHEDDLIGDADDNELWGGFGDDVLKGGGGADTLRGEEYDDILAGGTGDDVMRGGTGDDQFIVDSGGDAIIEYDKQGVDEVIAGVSYTLAAGASIETLRASNSTGTDAINFTGNEFVNAIFGNAGANILDGKAGADSMTGLGGDDWFYVDNAADAVFEAAAGGANDRVLTSVSYNLAAGQQVEMFTTDNNFGLSAINLRGNGVSNAIYGNEGVNIISGGGGNDSLSGFGGSDYFLFEDAPSAATADFVSDFNVVDDQIALLSSAYKMLAPGALAASAFHVGAAAADASDRVIYNSSTGALYYDADGTGAGAAIQFATLDAGLALTNADFQIA